MTEDRWAKYRPADDGSAKRREERRRAMRPSASRRPPEPTPVERHVSAARRAMDTAQDAVEFAGFLGLGSAVAAIWVDGTLTKVLMVAIGLLVAVAAWLVHKAGSSGRAKGEWIPPGGAWRSGRK